MGQTIVEKIFAAHLRDKPSPDNMVLDLDVVMCHEITTPIAIMDLIEKGMDQVFDTTKSRRLLIMSPPPRIPKQQRREK